MESQQHRASSFRALHRPGDPLVLVNVWDVGSALTVAGSGAAALATSSWAVARARGLDDGEQTPLDDVLALVRGIVGTVPRPLTVVPGLTDPGLVRTLVEGASLPVNVMVDADEPLDPLAAAGVARISFGASSYLAAMATLARLGQRDRRQDDGGE